MMKYCVALLAFLLVSCGLMPETLSPTDPRTISFLKAASAFDRSKYGFTPISVTDDIRLESALNKKYDAMLHVYTKTAHTIAFKKEKDGNYKWIGEQEIFNGPKAFVGPDGPLQENIVLEYQIEKIESLPTNKLVVSYYGDDKRFKKRPNLSLTDIQSLLKEWGY